MDLGHHTAGAAASVGFDVMEGGVEDAIEDGELPDLVGGERVEGLGGHDEEAFAGAVVDLEHIAGEVVHLRQCDRDECFAGGLDRADEMVVFVGVGQGVEAGDDVPVGNAHHDIGMIDGVAFVVNGGEDLGGVAGLGAKVEEDGLVCPRGEAGIGDLVVAIEHHAAGTFQVETGLLVAGEVKGPVDMEGLTKLFEDGGFAFEATIRGIHGEETDEARVMEGDPVVWKDGVGGKGFGGIIDDRYVDVIVAEDANELVEFLSGLLLGVGRGGGLEGVVDGGFRIEAEIYRPDHQDMGCRLHSGSFRVRRGGGAYSCSGIRRGHAIIRLMASG